MRSSSLVLRVAAVATILFIMGPIQPTTFSSQALSSEESVGWEAYRSIWKTLDPEKVSEPEFYKVEYAMIMGNTWSDSAGHLLDQQQIRWLARAITALRKRGIEPKDEFDRRRIFRVSLGIVLDSNKAEDWIDDLDYWKSLDPNTVAEPEFYKAEYAMIVGYSGSGGYFLDHDQIRWLARALRSLKERGIKPKDNLDRRLVFRNSFEHLKEQGGSYDR